MFLTQFVFQIDIIIVFHLLVTGFLHRSGGGLSHDNYLYTEHGEKHSRDRVVKTVIAEGADVYENILDGIYKLP